MVFGCLPVIHYLPPPPLLSILPSLLFPRGAVCVHCCLRRRTFVRVGVSRLFPFPARTRESETDGDSRLGYCSHGRTKNFLCAASPLPSLHHPLRTKVDVTNTGWAMGLGAYVAARWFLLTNFLIGASKAPIKYVRVYRQRGSGGCKHQA